MRDHAQRSLPGVDLLFRLQVWSQAKVVLAVKPDGQVVAYDDLGQEVPLGFAYSPTKYERGFTDFYMMGLVKRLVDELLRLKAQLPEGEA